MSEPGSGHVKGGIHSCNGGVIKALESRLAEKEKELEKFKEAANKAVCSYCGAIGEKTIDAMAKHLTECRVHPLAVFANTMAEKERVIEARTEALKLLYGWLCAARYLTDQYPEHLQPGPLMDQAKSALQEGEGKETR